MLCQSSVPSFCKYLFMLVYVLVCIIIVSLPWHLTLLNTKAKTIIRCLLQKTLRQWTVLYSNAIHELPSGTCLHASLVFLRSCYHWSYCCGLLLQMAGFVVDYAQGSSRQAPFHSSVGNSCPRKQGGTDTPSPTPLNPDIILQFLLFQLRQAQESDSWNALPKRVREI